MSARNYLGVTISTKQEQWLIPNIPFHCHVGPRQSFPHSENRPRVEFLTKQRNKAMSEGLALHPDTTHIVNIESNYLRQEHSIRKLIAKYEQLDDNVILGASTWAKMQDQMFTYYQFYDGWATPELFYLRYRFRRPKGIVQVSSVGSCLIFPIEVWVRHGFGIPEPFPRAGIYYNWLCERSQLPVLLDFDIVFLRDYRDSELIRYSSEWKRLKTTFWKPVRQQLLKNRYTRRAVETATSLSRK